MANLNVEVLGKQNLVAVLRTETDGQMAETHECEIEWTDGSITRAYVKRYSTTRQLALTNEITGYIVANGCDLPVPNHIGFIQLPSTCFPASHGNYIDWCFVASTVAGTTPKSVFSPANIAHSKTLLDLVANWNKIESVVAFDDWVANQDRNMGNLVVQDKQNIFLIDHGNLPVKLNWDISDLDPTMEAKSILMSMLYKFGCVPLPVKSGIAKATQEHSKVYNSVSNELQHWWNQLLVGDTARINALDAFLAARANLGTTRISKNYNMLVV
ncbi:hypothetical protein [Vibrio cionasavignyae]|uniref:hypothetical protein n=1 Tax=Vibrio cionasavignyae TaxID=2910252 RepID=UPI003D0A69FB